MVSYLPPISGIRIQHPVIELHSHKYTAIVLFHQSSFKNLIYENKKIRKPEPGSSKCNRIIEQ
jgi:hypothetical protein